MSDSNFIPTDQYIRRCRLLRVIDGDTLRVEVDLGWGSRLSHDCRLSGCDTPEPRGAEGPAGQFVTRQVEAFIGEETEVVIHSEKFAIGKYGRCLARVWIAGKCLNNWLLDSGLAWPTDSDGAIIGPRSLDRLQLPDAVRRKCLENFT